MREIKTHTVDPDDKLKLYAYTEPGGLSHRYTARWTGAVRKGHDIAFQNGPVLEHGINGVTEAALLAIVLDRLEHHQKGSHPSEMNASAIVSIRHGLECLHQRTRDRLARGVEGTSKA